MSAFDYDLFVIGAGSGGVRAARIAATLGARVGICEDQRLGGTCVNVGCVPKKLLVYGASYAEHLQDAAGFGWQIGPSTFSWPALIAAKDAEISRLNEVYGRLLRTAGAHIHHGRGRLLDAHTVQVGDQGYTAEHVLIATGSRPLVPELPGKEHVRTSDAVFSLPELPGRVVIVGGGYIGVELAGIFNALGSHTTLLDRNGLPLRGFDDDVRSFLAIEMDKKGVHLRPDAHVLCVEQCAEGGYEVVLDAMESLRADLVLYATGRVPNTAGLGLEEVGVRLGPRGGVEVDEHYTTSVPSVHAVGDVIDKLKLTPVALAEGMVLARRLFGGPAQQVDYRYVPTAVFSQPQVGTVGLTEAEARRTCGPVRVFKSSFRPMKHSLSGRDEKTLMKLVVDAASDRVVGVHVVGPEAGEIVQGFAVALTCGATKAQLDATIGIHPTAAEELVTMRTPEPEPDAQVCDRR
jgi:glutathione reductase (NADPH)